MNIHLDDQVLVITGKYRGKKGKIIRVYPKFHQVVVEKMNIRTKHIKKRPGQAGQKIHYEAPFDSSNVMILCPHCEKPTRTANTILQNGRGQRVCRKCKQSLDKTVERKQTKKR